MSVDRLKRDFLDAAQKYKRLYKESKNPEDLDKFKRLMDIYFHLGDIADDEIQDLQSVTDVGNTTTNSITVNGVTSPYFLLDTTATPTPQQGMLFWDADEETASVQVNGLNYEIGQGLYWVAKNQTGVQIDKGTAVYASGTLGTSGRILISPMIADGTIEAKYFLGIAAEDIANGDDGKVITQGKVRQIDTSTYTAGSVLWVSDSVAGGLTATKPTGSSLALAVAFVVESSANGNLAVRVSVLDENAIGGGAATTSNVLIDGGTFNTPNALIDAGNF